MDQIAAAVAAPQAAGAAGAALRRGSGATSRGIHVSPSTSVTSTRSSLSPMRTLSSPEDMDCASR